MVGPAMNHTGAFRALAVYLDRAPRCTAHPGCVLRPGHDGPPLVARVPEPLADVAAGEGDR